LCQLPIAPRGWCGGWRLDGGEGAGGGVGDGDPDGDLVKVFAVEGLDVQGVEESFDEGFGGVAQDAGQVGQFV
jgi:hypothetical protein